MTELGEQFISALADQGYGVVVTDEDVIVLTSDRRGRHHIPVTIFHEPELEILLRLAIVAFAALDGEFIWPWPPTGGARPGMN